MNKQSKILIATLFVTSGLITLVIFGFWLFSWRFYVWTNDASIEAFESRISSNVTEEVVALFVHEGQILKKGDPIASLRSDVPEAKKKEAEAKITQIEQEVIVKQASFDKVRNDYIRAEQGIKDQVISPQDFDHKQKDYEMAAGELQLALASLELAKKQLEVIKEELTHYKINSPMHGSIAQRWVWLGDVVYPGQSLYSLYDLENVWVLARLEETKIRHITHGQEAEIQVDAYPGITFTGHVTAIKGAASSQFTLVPQNNATGNYTKVAQRVPVKLSIKPPEDFPKDKPLYLFPGMNVEVWFKK